MRGKILCALLCVTLGVTAAASDTAVFASGPGQVALVELYTSEGCSSCPPADRWFTASTSHPGLWRDFVPVAFHVDYWDGLGWKDRFASPAWSARQRRHASEGGLGTVYTPGMVLNGGEWRRWGGAAHLGRGTVPAGDLRAELAGQALAVGYQPAPGPAQAYAVTVALLGSGLETSVRAGENRGRTLQHDFTVLTLTTAPLATEGDARRARLDLPVSKIPSRRRALAIWVTADRRLRPIQATGGWLAADAAPRAPVTRP